MHLLGGFHLLFVSHMSDNILSIQGDSLHEKSVSYVRNGCILSLVTLNLAHLSCIVAGRQNMGIA